MTFGEVTQVNGMNFVPAKFDGILGLAFQELSSQNTKSIIQYLHEQGQIKEKSFAFFLSKEPDSSGSVVTLGGVHANYSQEEIKFYNLTDFRYWMIGMDGFQMGELQYNETFNAIVDTGNIFFVDYILLLISMFLILNRYFFSCGTPRNCFRNFIKLSQKNRL